MLFRSALKDEHVSFQLNLPSLAGMYGKHVQEKAVKILTDNRAKLDELAKYLYEKETITGDEFMAILEEKDSSEN